MPPAEAPKAEAAPAKDPKVPPTPKDVAVRLRHLRGVLREISRRYAAEREAEISALVERLETKPSAPEAVAAAAEALASLSVKPERGRRKDLRRIEECLDLLDRLLA